MVERRKVEWSDASETFANRRAKAEGAREARDRGLCSSKSAWFETQASASRTQEGDKTGPPSLLKYKDLTTNPDFLLKSI